MDTSAYLVSQGWLGSGHSLNPTGRGTKKPLLVSKKSNVLGIGKKKHDVYADQWWARAFDSSLQKLDVSKNVAAVETKKAEAGSWEMLEMIPVGRRTKRAGIGGLYARFVRGAGLNGRLTTESQKETLCNGSAEEEEDILDRQILNLSEEDNLCYLAKEEQRKREREKRASKLLERDDESLSYEASHAPVNAEPIAFLYKGESRQKRKHLTRIESKTTPLGQEDVLVGQQDELKPIKKKRRI